MCYQRSVGPLVLSCLLVLAAAGASAGLSYNFESGVGRNGQAIGTDVEGLAFGTVSGGNVYYADINSGSYSVTSDNGKTFEDGEYFLSGDGSAYVANLADRAQISFTRGTATYVTVGYSSQFYFVIEAYNSFGDLLTSSTGGANTKSQGGAGLEYLTVQHSDIAYVVLHDHGGYWMVDNLSADAPVPEPVSLTVLALGLVSLVTRRRR